MLFIYWTWSCEMSAMSTCGWGGQKERDKKIYSMPRAHGKFDVMCLYVLLSMIDHVPQEQQLIPRLQYRPTAVVGQVRQWIDRCTIEKIDYIRMCNHQRAASDKVKYSWADPGNLQLLTFMGKFCFTLFTSDNLRFSCLQADLLYTLLWVTLYVTSSGRGEHGDQLGKSFTITSTFHSYLNLVYTSIDLPPPTIRAIVIKSQVSFITGNCEPR